MTNVVELSKGHNAKQKLSAISKVQMSGLELVRKRKARQRLATVRDIAKLDWEPWEKAETLGSSAKTMDYLGFYCRVSVAIMTRTKAELMKSHSEVEHKGIDKMMAGLMDTAEVFKSLASVAEAAYLRVLASASAHHLSGGKFKGVHDMRKKKRTLRQA
jgi:hypothetical protein